MTAVYKSNMHACNSNNFSETAQANNAISNVMFFN